MISINRLIFGGTSDAVGVCQQLDKSGIAYWLSVATPAGVQQSAALQGQVICGRMDTAAIIDFCRTHQIGEVFDLSHPYAVQVSENITQACQTLSLPLIRYVRPSLQPVASHPLLHRVNSIAQACEVAASLGERILLTTGSKQLSEYCARLANKHLLVRVLPTADVIAECEKNGLTIDQIIALKGPFSAEFNLMLYQFCRAEVVVTKESGSPGGFWQKVEPCLTLGIPCVVLARPTALPCKEGVVELNGMHEMLHFLATLTHNKDVSKE